MICIKRVVERKLNFFGHACRMNNERLRKTLVFGVMERPNKLGRHEIE